MLSLTLLCSVDLITVRQYSNTFVLSIKEEKCCTSFSLNETYLLFPVGTSTFFLAENINIFEGYVFHTPQIPLRETQLSKHIQLNKYTSTIINTPKNL